MSEPEQVNPKRRFWQIHLSTAVVLMFVAAPLSYVNTTPHLTMSVTDRKKFPLGSTFTLDSDQQGWPFDIYDRKISFGTASQIDRIPIIRSIIFNFLIAGLILLATVSLAEWLIRRREGRKP